MARYTDEEAKRLGSLILTNPRAYQQEMFDQVDTLMTKFQAEAKEKWTDIVLDVQKELNAITAIAGLSFKDSQDESLPSEKRRLAASVSIDLVRLAYAIGHKDGFAKAVDEAIEKAIAAKVEAA